jgi:nucleoid DNA-binding protein
MAVAPRKARQHKKRKNINIVSSHVVKLKQGRWLHTKSGRM